MANNNKKMLPRVKHNRKSGLKTVELMPGRHETDEEVLGHLIYGLRPIINDAVNEIDPSALERLLDIHKLIYPEHYEVSPSVARAMMIRRLMGKLSRVVKPIKGEGFLRDKSYIKLTDNEERHNFKEYKLAKRYLQQRKNGRFTLQSLAISIFIEQADKEGRDGISQRTIERDLRAARLFDKKQEKAGRPPEFNMILASGESLPSHKFTEDWKRRKRFTDKKS